MQKKEEVFFSYFQYYRVVSPLLAAVLISLKKVWQTLSMCFSKETNTLSGTSQ